MVIFLLAAAVFCGTVIWPLNRWVMHHQGRAPVYGFWISVTAAIIAAALAFLRGQSLLQPAVWAVGATMGFAFAFGYCLVVMYCLRIGPTAPTVVMNNMGLIWPIITGAFWPTRRLFNFITILGLILICAAFVLFGFIRSSAEEGNNSRPVRNISTRWFFWALLAWLLSGISMTAQFVGSVCAYESPLVFVCSFATTSALILVFPFLYEIKKRFEIKEMIAGVINGIIMVSGLFATLTVLQYVGPEMVFSFTVAGPIILILLIGQFLYREPMDKYGWGASFLGVLGLIFLSVGR